MPDFLELADTGRKTSRLGFGCSILMGRTGRKHSLQLLETAYDAGIQHFDVAPMYGYGEAEGCLGEFLERRRDITVTTKFGIAPAPYGRWGSAARRLAREALRFLPETARLRGAAAIQDAATPKLPFTASQAATSLEQSLRRLRTERIDLWLLHEATAADLCDDGLLRFLENAVTSGKVGSYGVGSDARDIPALVADRPEYCRVLQFEWSLFDAILRGTPSFRVHHRSLTEHFAERHRWLASDAARCAEWSQAVGHDLRQPSELAALMLRAALDCNSQGIVLFSSRSPEHIRRNAEISDDSSLRSAALRLQELASRESARERSIATGRAFAW